MDYSDYFAGLNNSCRVEKLLKNRTIGSDLIIGDTDDEDAESELS
jgi:hypothetical protein